jgi:hypothetical protein
MSVRKYISVAGLLVLTTSVKAQTTLHADPRLSVLAKKPHTIEQVTASAAVKHKKIPKIAMAADGVPYTSQPQSPGQPTKVLGYAAGASKPDAAVKPLPDENGHAAGWTPPVHAKPGRYITARVSGCKYIAGRTGTRP